MNYTENYQLNQWEPADRVLRTDFNEDNRKIDEALAAIKNACPIEKITCLTLQSDARQADLSLRNIDLSIYHHLELYIVPGISTTAKHYSLLCNGETSGYLQQTNAASALAHISCITGPENSCFQKVDIYPGGNRDVSALVCYAMREDYGSPNFSSSISASYHCWTHPVTQLHTLNLSADDSEAVLGAGTKLDLYGLRK